MGNNTKSWLLDSGEYRSWIAELKRRYRVTQIKAAMSVNTALLEYYWNLGKDISERYADAAAYGMGFFDHLSADMKSAMPGADGFSPRNLRYCQRFYELYKAEENLPQLVAELVRDTHQHHFSETPVFVGCGVRAVETNETSMVRWTERKTRFWGVRIDTHDHNR